MSSLSGYANWVAATREARLHGPGEMINDAALNNFSLAWFMRNRPQKQVIRGGKWIEGRVKLNELGGFSEYEAGSVRTVTRRQTYYAVQYPWRLFENPTDVTDVELEMNEEADEFSRWVNFRDQMDSDLKAEHIQGIEDRLWARPDTSLMESLSVKKGKMYSIPAWFPENGIAPIGFTTLAQINPTTYANWRSPKETYDHTNLDDATNGLFAAFDRIAPKLVYSTYPGAQREFQQTSFDDVAIFTNLNGKNIYEGLLRQANDNLRRDGTDPFRSSAFNGREVTWVNKLDTALLDQSGGAYTDQAYPTGKPRYFLVNRMHTYIVVHKDKFMKPRDPILGGALQPDVLTFWRYSWMNSICESRKRGGGIICPANP